jgi:hypothetical protein
MSLGGGLFFGSDFGGGAKYEGTDAATIGHDEHVTPVYGMGVHTFFDYQYVEAGLSLFFGGGAWGPKKDGEISESVKWDASITSINIDVLGKYPMEYSDKISWFPIFGLGYHIVVAGKGGTKTTGEIEFDGGVGDGVIPKAIEFSALWFKFGGGVDYAISDKLYARGELLYGIRLANGYENNILTNEDKMFVSGKARLGHGIKIRAGVGYYL